MNYTRYQINRILSQYNDVIFGLSQVSHPDSYYDDYFY